MKAKSLFIISLLILVIILTSISVFNKQKTKSQIPLNATISNNIAISPSSSSATKGIQGQDIKDWTDTIHTGSIIDGFIEHPNMIKIDKYDGQNWCRRYIVEASTNKAYILDNGAETKLSHDDIKKWPKDKYISFTLYYNANTQKTQSNVTKAIVSLFRPEVGASCKYDYIVNDSDVQKIVFSF